MAATLDLSAFARPREDGSLGMEFALEGVSCGGCISRIETALKRIPGVVEARLNFTTKRLSVAWNNEVVAPGDVVLVFERMGYGAHPFAAKTAEDDDDRQAKQLLKYLGVAGF